MARKAAHQGRPPSLATATFPAPDPDGPQVGGKLTNWCRIATRNDRLARDYWSVSRWLLLSWPGPERVLNLTMGRAGS